MEEFTNLIKIWIDQVETRSISTLAKKSGLGQSTVRRAITNEGKPTEATMRAILRVVTDIETAIKILKEVYPRDGATMEDYHKGVGHQFSPESDGFRNLDQLGFEILSLCWNKHGYRYEDLVSRLGQNGEKRIEQYLAKGTLKLQAGRLFAEEEMLSDPRTLAFSVENSAHLVGQNLDKTHHIFSHIDRYTIDEFRKIESAMENLCAIIADVHENPRPVNGIPACIGAVMGFIDFERTK